MQRIKFIMMCIVCFSIFSFSKCKNDIEKKVLVNYGDFDPETVKGYDYLIIESAHFSADDIKLLKTHNQNVLAYVSFGEVNESASHYSDISKYTLSKNEVWNSYVLDLANKNTRQAVFKIVQNNIEEKGFDGLFLDNIDNYTSFGPTPYKLAALVSFLKEIKEKYPTTHLMQNAGLEVLPKTKDLINSIAVESIATDYNFETSTYKLRESKDFKERLDHLNKISQQFGLPTIVIEYADTRDLAKEVHKRMRSYKTNLFIGEIELQNIPRYEP